MRPRFLLLLILVTPLCSCSGYKSSPMAIRDFRGVLQPYLTDLVARGIVAYDTSMAYIEKQATDDELRHLSKCEHPVLRAIAFRAMLERDSFDHFDVMMNNLDDTATVATDNGEWGIKYNTVSDDLLEHGRWKDTISRRRTIEEVVLHHRRLKAAFSHVYYLSRMPAGYSIIRDMALTKQDDVEYSRKLSFTIIGFQDRELALYYLAQYKKVADVPLIKQVLLQDAWRLTETSYRLLRDFPDTSYMEIFQSAFRNVYRNLADNRIAERLLAFAKSLASQKNEQSAAILQYMLKRTPIVPSNVDSSTIRYTLYHAILDNPCAAYAHLRATAEEYVKEKDAWTRDNSFALPPGEHIYVADTAKEPIRWWSR